MGDRPGPIRVGDGIREMFAPILGWLGDEVQLDRRYTLAEVAIRAPASLRAAIGNAGVGHHEVRILDWTAKTAVEAAAEAGAATGVAAVYLGTDGAMREVFLDTFTGWRLVGLGSGRHAVGLVLSETVHDRLLFTTDAATPAVRAVRPMPRWWWLVAAALLVVAGILFPPLLALYAVIGLAVWLWRNRP